MSVLWKDGSGTPGMFLGQAHLSSPGDCDGDGDGALVDALPMEAANMRFVRLVLLCLCCSSRNQGWRLVMGFQW